jgi:hypothetical protein
VSQAILSAWTVRNYSEGRLVGTGDTTRAISVCVLLGMRSLVKFIREETDASDHYLHGWERFDDSLCRFVFLTAIATYPADAFVIDLLEDGRLARRLPEVKEVVQEEVDFIQNIELNVWVAFAQAAACGVGGLRSDTVHAALTIQSYLEWLVFRKAEEPPFDLPRGDVVAHLRALAAGPKPSGVAAANLWALQRAEYDQEYLVKTVNVLGEADWSDLLVEQGHKPIKRLKQQHPTYPFRTLLVRDMVMNMHTLVAPKQGGGRAALGAGKAGPVVEEEADQSGWPPPLLP